TVAPAPSPSHDVHRAERRDAVETPPTNPDSAIKRKPRSPARSGAYCRCAIATAASASTMPAPKYLSHSTWLGCFALRLSTRSTSSGLVTPSPTMSAATPAAWGDAIDVPWNHRYSLTVGFWIAIVFCSTPSGLPSPFLSDRVSPPGAATSIAVPQLLEKLSPRPEFVAAAAIAGAWGVGRP